MPGRINKKSFLKRVKDRIVRNLSGNSHYRDEHLTRPVRTKVSSIPTPQRHKKRRSFFKSVKNRFSKYFRRIINPEPNQRKKRLVLNVETTSPVGYSTLIPSEPAMAINSTANTVFIKPEPIQARPKLRSKRKPFFKRIFGRPKKRKEEQAFARRKIRNEILEALPPEGFALLNSSGLFILAYLVVYLFYQLSGAIAASFYGIDSVLFYYELYFPIGNASPLWNRLNIIVITLVSPLISVMISMILLKVVLIREKLKPQLRLFLLWVAFHGATHFLGAFVAGIATSQGFGYVANWMYMNVFFRILLALIFLFLMTTMGYYSVGFALETLPQGIRQQRWRLNLALVARFILPWIVGGLLIMAVKYPNATPQHGNISIYDTIIMATMGFMIIPAFFNNKAMPRASAERPNRYKRPSGIMIFALAFITLIFFRLFLERGLHFVIQFSFDVGLYR